MRAYAPAVGLAGLVAHAGPSVTTSRRLRMRWLPTLAGVGDPGHVALTFDDGPDPASTPLFLDLLSDLGVRATFFVLGRMLQAAPDLGRRIVDGGHELAVHGWSHRNLLLLGPRRTYHELSRTRDLIVSSTGEVPRFFRPPYGVTSTASLLAARRTGLQPVLWTAWGRDWTATATPGSVLRLLQRDLAGGGTVLLHDSDCTSAPGSWRATLGSLPDLVERCRARRWSVGPLREHG